MSDESGAAGGPPAPVDGPGDAGPAAVAALLRAARDTLPPAYVEWRGQRGRPRARTLRRITRTTELLLRIESELLLPALAGGGGTAEAEALRQEIELLRDVIGTVVHGAPGRREASVAVLEGLGAEHGRRMDDWLRTLQGPPRDVPGGGTWPALAERVHERLQPWVRLAGGAAGDEDDDAVEADATDADDLR